MSDDLARQMRQQSAQAMPVLESLGEIRTVAFLGNDRGLDVYAIEFANGATEWKVGFNEAGKLAALLFRPAE